MPSFAELIAQGSAQAWLFVPSAILLGALHGLEPGHSKTMMAAFIVAIRGTVRQAVYLGIAATISHTAIVWGIALAGMYLWRGVEAEAVEPWFQLLSGLIIIGVAAWMVWRTHADRRSFVDVAEHAHPHDGPHHIGRHPHDHDHPEHHHAHEELAVLETGADAYQDAHQRAHAGDIARRFADRNVTNWQIILFGLTGGLIPCPAAITVLLLCLQLKEITLGAVLVLCFSIGLAITLVAVGVVAALGARHAGSRFPWLSRIATRAPYVSGLLILVVGLYVGAHGIAGLAG